MHLTSKVILALSAAGLLAAQTALPSSDQEAAIIRLVQRYVDARDQNNASALTELFTPDADQLVSSGEWRKGREALVKGVMASSKREAGDRRSIRIETVRFLTPDVAIADGRYELAAPGSEPRKMIATFVLQRVSGNWLISAIRNMLPAPGPGYDRIKK